MEYAAIVGSGLASATAAAGTGLSSLASSVTTGTLMQGGLTAVSALSSIAGGARQREQGAVSGMFHSMAAENARSEATAGALGEEFNARSEVLAGANAAVALKENLLRTVGGQRVAFAASGVDPFSGTAATLEDTMRTRVGQDADTIGRNAEVARLSRLIRASQLRQQGIYAGLREDVAGSQAIAAGVNAESSGWMRALGDVFKFGADVKNRK